MLENLIPDIPVVVGGPAVKLMPDYLAGLPLVSIGGDIEGVLQRVNPQATRTTTGCANKCEFCGVPTIEPGGVRELADWPDLPIICDNNVTAASAEHFERVCRRLAAHGWCDFNQGVDAARITAWHARRIASIGKPIVRLSIDGEPDIGHWAQAFYRLRVAGVSARAIRTYVLVGFDADPAEAWRRCEFVARHKTHPLPMWYHALDALAYNQVTPEQARLGWTDAERRRIMAWFYQRRKIDTPRRRG